ncbi:hypothetical protein SAMN06297129_3433 [Pseudooceanicola antarcticus]|uniref:Uncharacterized protein n=1 Tax=Pseudooceanicola antarcticus TaxID=1247613 RepID=A0A285JEZ3_9RHOB|nr:hypothetical protein [Pseudooceanicola antarcticus]SNY57731.1 hypothetical protein SAMN06297129_3433 [Pseudooceanicola antarcticus]
MSQEAAEQELARVGIGAARRVVGLTVTGGLAVVLAWLALTPDPVPLGLRLLLLALAGLEALVVWRLYQATQKVLVLTAEGLREEGGIMLVRMEQIAAVDRGLFAFKPSNGFLLKLTERGPLRFRPGLYWQFGKRLGVGGLVRGAEGKQMADALALYMAHKGQAES